ncbi:hypothetical protein D3C76_1271270 [compost metagenome]
MVARYNVSVFLSFEPAVEATGGPFFVLKNLNADLIALNREKWPLSSFRLIGSPKQYTYGFKPPFPNGLKLSGLLNRINTGLNAR